MRKIKSCPRAVRPRGSGHTGTIQPPSFQHGSPDITQLFGKISYEAEVRAPKLQTQSRLLTASEARVRLASFIFVGSLFASCSVDCPWEPRPLDNIATAFERTNVALHSSATHRSFPCWRYSSHLIRNASLQSSFNPVIHLCVDFLTLGHPSNPPRLLPRHPAFQLHHLQFWHPLHPPLSYRGRDEGHRRTLPLANTPRISCFS